MANQHAPGPSFRRYYAGGDIAAQCPCLARLVCLWNKELPLVAWGHSPNEAKIIHLDDTLPRRHGHSIRVTLTPSNQMLHALPRGMMASPRKRPWLCYDCRVAPTPLTGGETATRRL